MYSYLRDTTLVTVVIPTLRRPNYLKLAIESVLSQTYDPIEIIVSDNGSGDDTPNIVRGYSAPNLRFRQNPITIDLYSHMNQCLYESKGKYFVAISDDDLISPNFIEALVNRMNQVENAVVALTRCELIDICGKKVRDLGQPNNVYDGYEFIINWLYGRKSTHFATLFSMFTYTDMIRQVGGFPVFPGNSNSDNAVFIKIALQGRVVFARDAVFYYRVYESSYGLSTPYWILSRSFNGFIEYIEKNALTQLSKKRRNQILKGVKRGSASYYLNFISMKLISVKSFKECVKAIFSYSIDVEYLKTLPLLPLFVLRQAYRRLIG